MLITYHLEEGRLFEAFYGSAYYGCRLPVTGVVPWRLKMALRFIYEMNAAFEPTVPHDGGALLSFRLLPADVNTATLIGYSFESLQADLEHIFRQWLGPGGVQVRITSPRSTGSPRLTQPGDDPFEVYPHAEVAIHLLGLEDYPLEKVLAYQFPRMANPIRAMTSYVM